MNSNFTKLILFTVAPLIITLTALDILSFSYGFTGVTKKDGGAGCVCHNFEPSPDVSVFFTGPDSVPIGQTVLYKIAIAHGPASTGGFDLASFAGTLDTSYTDVSIKKDTARGELTHKFPKPFVNDTVFWTFKYTAPSTPQVDTLYAVGNSTNNNGVADTLDKWNFSPNFPIKIYIPISVSNEGKIIKGYNLHQNYPNPFNPVTKIRFNIPLLSKEGQERFVALKIYNILGKEISTLVNEPLKPGSYEVEWSAANGGKELPSGVYFYKLITKDFTDTKKMVLTK